MAEFAIGPVTEIGKCFAPFMKRQLNYLCCFNANVQRLTEEANELEAERAALQMKINEAENDAGVIDPRVVIWMKNVDDILLKKSELVTEIERIGGGGCLSVGSRYSASRGAVKAAAAMKQKREDRAAISDIAHPPPPPSTVPGNLEPSNEFESRKKIEQDLMRLLKDEDVKMSGICGMGGVGKTTLAKKVKKKMMEEKVFGESVMAVVSQPANTERILEDIAAQLGLKFDDHEKSLFSRATRLRTRLGCKKRILIVLDDVWEYLNLEELGIPCESGPEGCTILLTSRNRNVLERMNAQPVLEMQILSEKEALSFFREQLGACANDQNWFPSLAQQITKECRGLPLALAIVAQVLKGQMNRDVWEDALGELRRSNPKDLQQVVNKVYIPLRLSYDYLSRNAKSIFLLCSLFSEDFDIPLSHLTAYAMGLHMFEGIQDLETVRTKTHSLVHTLKSLFLLLEGRDGHVRMHDIVRDVAIFIASEENPLINSAGNPLIKCGYDSFWISPFVGGERIELSRDSIFPKLRVLLIDNESTIEELQVSDISFEAMKELNVLSIRCNNSLTSFPLPQNLKSLILVKCKSLTTLSVVGKLMNLETFICCDCDVVVEFPSEILKNLRWLEISRCPALEKIGSDNNNFGHQIVRSKLESLVLCDLPSLAVFYHGIESIEFPLLTQLEIEECPELKGVVCSGESVGMGKDDHSLHLLCKHKVSFGKLRKLRLEEIRKCNIIFCSCQVPFGSFTHLQEIHLRHLPKLQNFCNSALELPQLVKLHIDGCPEMTSFNSGSLNTPNVKSLESLRIQNCSMMKHVFLWSKEGENEKGIIGQSSRHIPFPKLTTLELANLPHLKNLYKGVENIEFPLLAKMDIQDLATTCSIQGDSNYKVSLQFTGNTNFMSVLCCQIPSGSFTQLEELEIMICGIIKSLFPVSIAQNLKSLKVLRIERCKEMVKVIEEESSHDTILVFPHLKMLCLMFLPKLKTFCKCALGLPELVQVKIYHCPEMVRFNSGSLTTTNLKSLESLTIKSCWRMEQVFLWSIQETIGQTITLPKLTTLDLSFLPGLTNIFRGVETIEFPLLTKMTIRNCPNLKSGHVSATTCSNLGDINKVVGKEETAVYYNSSSLPLWDQFSIHSFTRLEQLRIFGYNENSSLFSCSVAVALLNLKFLGIGDCRNMVKMIEEEYSSDQTTPLFPHLEYLILSSLPKLKIFCEWRCALEFPSLKQMRIYGDCNKMERFSLGSLTAPNLKTIEIKGGNIITVAGADLNHVLHQLFITREESTSSKENVWQENNEKKKGNWKRQNQL